MAINIHVLITAANCVRLSKQLPLARIARRWPRSTRVASGRRRATAVAGSRFVHFLDFDLLLDFEERRLTFVGYQCRHDEHDAKHKYQHAHRSDRC